MKYKQVMESLAQPTTIDKAIEAAYALLYFQKFLETAQS